MSASTLQTSGSAARHPEQVSVTCGGAVFFFFFYNWSDVAVQSSIIDQRRINIEKLCLQLLPTSRWVRTAAATTIAGTAPTFS